MNLKAVVVAFLFVSTVRSAKILAVFPMAARSHYILGNALMRGLAEKGHDVTMVSPFTETDPPKNGSYRDIVLTGFVEEHEQKLKQLNLFESGKKNVFLIAPLFLMMFIQNTENVLKHPNVQDLINSDEKFDIVIVEHFMNEAHKAFASRFNAPLIIYNTLGANSWINYLVANPTPVSYVPDGSLGYSSKMSFCERIANSVMYAVYQIAQNLYVFPKHKELVKKYFPNGPDLESIMYNASLVLLNSHPSTNQPVPFVPSMIDVGGLHVKPPKKLPKDLQDFLDSAKDGVIYLSFGSNLKSTQLPAETRQVFLNVFSKLSQKVLWKWEEDNLPGKPPNVHTSKWLPQQDVLAHPNIRLFITHSGLLSTIETIYHGIPVLAIPIGGDQKLNAQQMVDQGIGLKITYSEISEVVLTTKIKELLTNPKYSQIARKRSQFFHDRPVKPLDLAIYWIEYVLRHGTSHLRVAGLDLPWYKYHLLDVAAFLAATSLIFIYASYKITKKLICFVIGKRQTKKVKKN